jgi:predicted ATP-dependent endonuclease of OLD family
VIFKVPPFITLLLITTITSNQAVFVPLSSAPFSANRLYATNKDSTKRESFNKAMAKILGRELHRTIDANAAGHYLKFTFGETTHNSDGVGDGIISLFSIIDSLYDSGNGAMIVIDEPELSLHPMYQKRLMRLLVEYSKDRQIVIFTHSPYFIDWESLFNTGKIYRTVREENGIRVYSLKGKTVEKFKGFLTDYRNPHTLGLEAREVFFLEDKIIVVEGQEDVWFYKHTETLKDIKGDFFGWGAGGSEKIKTILEMLLDLGFKKIVVVLDADKTKVETGKKTSTYDDLVGKYADKVKILFIPSDDIRDKDEQKSIPAKIGLVEKNADPQTGLYAVKSDYAEKISKLIKEINDHFSGS